MTISAPGTAAPLSGMTISQNAPPPRWSRQVAMDIVGGLDITAVVLGAIVPAWIYASAGGLEIRTVVVCQAALVTSMLMFACLRAWNMYDLTRLNDLPVFPGKLFAALMIATVAALGLGVPFTVVEIHLWIWYAAWISASYTLILGARLLSRSVLARLTAAGRFDTRVAVFGAGEIARRVQDHLKTKANGIHFVGVFDDRPRDRLDADGLQIKGRLEDLIKASRDGSIDRIVLALPQSADRRMSTIAAQLQQLPVSLHVVTHIASDLVEDGPAHQVSSLGSVGLLDVKDKPLTDWAPFAKRCTDVVIGGALLIISLPLMLLIALAIKLETSGPAIFTQRRRGLNLVDLDVFKFRTMRVIENGAHVEQAHEDDERVTRVGSLLRRTSLDELPQLFNVLNGEMSLVGPRPHAIAHDEKWSEMLATYGVRNQVKPGITGLAQVDGCRGEIHRNADLEARVQRDLEYIRNWSIALDLKIIARTLGAALVGKNAH